jgi:hypothetical protein
MNALFNGISDVVKPMAEKERDSVAMMVAQKPI